VPPRYQGVSEPRRPTLAEMQRFVKSGQAAQRAVDQVLAQHAAAQQPPQLRRRYTPEEVREMVAGPGPVLDDDLPPWKRCRAVVLPFCPGWTRGDYCPQHRGLDTPAGQGAPGGRTTPPARTVATLQGVKGSPAPVRRQKNAPATPRRDRGALGSPVARSPSRRPAPRSGPAIPKTCRTSANFVSSRRFIKNTKHPEQSGGRRETQLHLLGRQA